MVDKLFFSLACTLEGLYRHSPTGTLSTCPILTRMLQCLVCLRCQTLEVLAMLPHSKCHCTVYLTHTPPSLHIHVCMPHAEHHYAKAATIATQPTISGLSLASGSQSGMTSSSNRGFLLAGVPQSTSLELFKGTGIRVRASNPKYW